MYKDLPSSDEGQAVKRWKPVVIKHGQFKMRTYARIGEGRPQMGAMLPPNKRQARAAGGGGGPTSSAAGQEYGEDHRLTASRSVI